MPGTLHRDNPEHPDAKAREKEIEGAFNGQAPADEGDDGAGETRPDLVEGNNEGAEWKMDEGVYETADFAFLAQHDEELNPDAGLKDVRKAGDQEEDCREFLDRDLHVLI